jgi:hypothetical protein
MFGVLLAAYLHKVCWDGLKVTSVRGINTKVPWFKVDDLINDHLLVGAQLGS